jgi:hypothetical protein
MPATVRLRHIEWQLDRPAQINVSAYTGSRKVVANPWHGKWTAKVQLAAIQGEANVLTWRSFFAKLKGSINTFQLPATEAAQHGSGTSTVSSGGAQGATTMVLNNTPPLVAGMMATVTLPSGNKQLLLLTADISGSTITFEPPMRETASVGAVVDSVNPFALVCLSDSSFGWSLDPARMYNIGFDVVEAF